MPPESYQRKLTAILSADVAGYSRLMSEDESATVKTLATYREIMASLIKQHRGRVVDSPGDNVLAEFSSVVDAVQCAVAVQKEFQSRNAELPENRRMEFRFGINLGDVIEEEGRIYGDGVNIAARLEALADPGGICVSKTAFDQIETKLPLGYEYLGEQPVKNIPKPVGAYRVLMEPRVTVAEEIEKEKTVSWWRRKSTLAGGVALVLVIIAGLIWNFYFRRPSVEPASIEKMAYPLPDKPSIAVLPFVNMSGDSDQEYIADGITENITAALSKIKEMFVIARSSTMIYKGKPVKVKQVSEELGVRYVLEGSLLKEGDRVRITAQLVDAIKGHHLWAERYDRDMKNLLGFLDEITKEIVTSLQVQLTLGEYARVIASTDNFEAWSYFSQGHRLWYQGGGRENTLKARELFERAAKLDPEYVLPVRLLAFSHIREARARWGKSHKQSMKLALEYAQKALEIDESNPGGHAVMSRIYQEKRQYEKAIAAAERAIELDPNYAPNHHRLSVVLFYSGRFEETIELVKTAMRLHGPHFPAWYLNSLGRAHWFLGHYEEALETYKKLFQRRKGKSDEKWIHWRLARTYLMLGQVEEARKHAGEALRLTGKRSLERLRKTSRFKDPVHTERLIDAYRKLGVPEKLP